MKISRHEPNPNPASAATKPQMIHDWQVRRCGTVESTQREAAELPAWHAVLAREQTGGRGQYERTFTSDPGGFYLTAVLPYDGDSARWRGFALAVGWAVQKQLRAAGVEAVRLRWPNDLMIGRRKVGGILVEQGQRHTLLVGLGLNVRNEPWRLDPTLGEIAGRLGDQPGGHFGDPERLLEPMLAALREAYGEFLYVGLAGMTSRLNACWQGVRSVRLELLESAPQKTSAGFFIGIDPDGCLLIKNNGGELIAVAEHHVRRLHEV